MKTGANCKGSDGRVNKAYTFADLFCLRNECTRADYQERAFGELLYAHAKWIAVAIRRCNRGAFTEDIQFIRDIGETTELTDALSLVARFQKASRARRTLRTLLRFRVSDFKTSLLAYSVFRTSDGGQAAGAPQSVALRHQPTSLGA